MTTHKLYGSGQNLAPDIPLTPILNREQFDGQSFTTSDFLNDKPWLKSEYSVTVEDKAGDQGKHRFKSYRLKGPYEKSWQSDPRMNKSRLPNWIVRACVIIGIGLSAFINYWNYKGVAQHDVSFPKPLEKYGFTER